MCTVTFIPYKNGVILSSNRDEKTERPKAFFPEIISLTNTTLFYPKDGLANGTWFICDSNFNAGVLLNGAQKNHTFSPPYKHSRGLILTEIFKDENPLRALTQYDLNGIENFTLILYVNQNLFQATWNGEKLNILLKDNSFPHIWSSVTLYSNKMIKERESWFKEWIKNNDTENIFTFHSEEKKENNEYGIFMNRNNEIQTVSITSLKIENQKAELIYKDILNNTEKSLTVQPQQPSLNKL